MLEEQSASTKQIIGEHLTLKISQKVILDDVSFAISLGAYHAIVGENGSGKTSLVKMIINAYPPTAYAGQITVNRAKGRISYMPETALFPAFQTTQQYLFHIALLLNASPATARFAVSRALDEMGITHLKKRFPSRLSSGEQKKVQLAKIIIEAPSIIIMDEPAAHLDFLSRANLNQFLSRYHAKGVTVVIISHLVKEIQDFVDEITILHHSKLLFNGPIMRGELTAIYDRTIQKLSQTALTAEAHETKR